MANIAKILMILQTPKCKWRLIAQEYNHKDHGTPSINYNQPMTSLVSCCLASLV